IASCATAARTATSAPPISMSATAPTSSSVSPAASKPSATTSPSAPAPPRVCPGSPFLRSGTPRQVLCLLFLVLRECLGRLVVPASSIILLFALSSWSRDPRGRGRHRRERRDGAAGVDAAPWRIAIHPGDRDQLLYLGWEVGESVDAAVERLEAAGVDVRRDAAAGERPVPDVGWFRDPFA